MRVVGCFICYEGTFVLLQRHPQKPEPYTWGLPAGKVNKDEKDEDAMVREIREETGLTVLPEQLTHLLTMQFSGPGGTGTFLAYRYDAVSPFDIVLDPNAHIASDWVTGYEALTNRKLITQLNDVITTLGYDKHL